MTFEHEEFLINYTDEGAGKAVVLIHGFGEDETVWHYQREYLQGSCRLIIPTLPGCNGTRPLMPGKDYALKDFAELVHALLLYLKIDNCILLGHSMGGYITLAFAQHYPGMLQAFGLVHSSAFADGEEKKAMRQKNICFLEKNDSYTFIKATAPNLFGNKFKQEHPNELATLIEKGKTLDAVSLQAYTKAMMQRPDTTNALAGSKVPVLFVVGTEDKAVLLKDVLQQTHLPQIAFIHIIEGAAHMGMWEAKEEVNKWLAEFVAQAEQV